MAIRFQHWFEEDTNIQLKAPADCVMTFRGPCCWSSHWMITRAARTLLILKGLRMRPKLCLTVIHGVPYNGMTKGWARVDAIKICCIGIHIRTFQRIPEIVLTKRHLTHKRPEGFQRSRGRAWPTGREMWKSDRNICKYNEELGSFWVLSKGWRHCLHDGGVSFFLFRVWLARACPL